MRLDDCVFVVEENCATSQRIATLMGLPPVGCASHDLNFASDHWDQVKKLMTKRKGLNQSEKLSIIGINSHNCAYADYQLGSWLRCVWC
ncbi:hypothetical protein GQ600_1910 [Phytophthora cactorum]|nr:hypothetical protein GQ600_1910 [Phytophthora cactorum]